MKRPIPKRLLSNFLIETFYSVCIGGFQLLFQILLFQIINNHHYIDLSIVF